MILSKYEKALYYEIFNNNEYGKIKDNLNDAKVIFDIGGHIGLFSLYCFEHNKNLKIHIFEPVKENFNKISKNLIVYLDNCILNNVGVSYRNYFDFIYINKEKSMQCTLYENNFLCNSNQKQKIKLINLFEYIENNNLNSKNSIDIVKIDIEGAEFDLLLNIDEKFFDVTKSLIIEYHILSDLFSSKYSELIKKLGKYYKNIEINQSKYSEKLGIIWCNN